jgi:hypothetical protein
MTMTAPTLPTSRFPHTARVASSHESTSIVIMHDTNTATFLRASGCVRREPVIDLTMMMWVSRSARAIHSPSFLLPLPCMVPCCESVRTRTTLSIPSLFFFRQQDTHLCAAIVATPNFRSPDLHLELLRDMPWKTRFHFYPTHSSTSPTYLFISLFLCYICRLSGKLEFLNRT